jgi:hypothetical protein
MFNLESDFPVEYHVVCDFFRNKDGTLCYRPQKSIDISIEQFEKLFGTNSKE